MNIQYFDDLSNFLRVAFLLFHSIIFYYITFWRIKIEPKIDKKISFSFLAVFFLNFTLNLIIVFRKSLSESYFYLIAINTTLIIVVIFLIYSSLTNYKKYYLILPFASNALFIFTGEKLFIFIGLILITLPFFYLIYKEKFSQSKPSDIAPSLVKRGIHLPFVFFSLYLLSIPFYILTESIFFNITGTIFTFFALYYRVSALYERRLRAFLFYILLYILSFSLIFYLATRYIIAFKATDEYHTKIKLQRLIVEIKDKINSYSNFIKIIASSEEIKNKIKKGSKELNQYLSYVNQSLNTDIIFLINKDGIVKACSAEYRNLLLNKNLKFRKYFLESINGKLSVFIARGVLTEKEDIRISYPVQDKNKIIGVLVMQFPISEILRKEIEIENMFILHVSGAVLFGKKELENKFLFKISEETLNKLYDEKILGNISLQPADIKQISSDLFEFKKQKFQLIKENINSDFYLAGFLNIDKYEKIQLIFLIFSLIITYLAHSQSIKNLERLRSIFIKLSEEEEERKIYFNTIDTGIIYVDSDGKIKHLNKESVKLLNLYENPIGQRFRDIVELSEHPNPEYMTLKTPKKEIPIIYNEKPVIVNDIKFGDVITIKDATEIIQHQEALRKLEKLDVITKITSGIVHDFNNYLFALTGNLSLLKEIEKDEKKKIIILRMLEATKIMGNIIEELKDLSPDFVSKKEEVNIIQIAQNCLEFILNGTNIKFNLKTKEPLSKIYANPGQIYRIFQNIIVNAKQAMQNVGNIEVNIKNIFNEGQIIGFPKGKFILIEIADTGPGIPPEYVDKIFDPFFTMKKEGKGLGLSIVKNIIEKLGGKIEVESTPGKGTIFKIFLPVLE